MHRHDGTVDSFPYISTGRKWRTFYFLPIQPDIFRSSMYIQTKLAPAFVIKFFKAKKLYLEIDSFAHNTEQPSLVGGFSLISSLQNCQLFVATLLTKKEYIAFTFISPSCFQAIISFWICKPTIMQRMRAISKMKWCHSLVLFTQLSAWGIKCPALLVVFGVILVLVNLCLHTFTHMTVISPGVGVGDYQQKRYSCWIMYCCIRKIHGDTWQEVLAS